eukprot:4569635-Alexandrium_andersonii.AAC.1
MGQRVRPRAPALDVRLLGLGGRHGGGPVARGGKRPRDCEHQARGRVQGVAVRVHGAGDLGPEQRSLLARPERVTHTRCSRKSPT